MSAPSPGPWTVLAHHGSADEDRITSWLVLDADGVCLAECYPDHDDAQPIEADARMMAAARELYAALDAMTRRLVPAARALPVAEVALAALAKARGEAE